jgi:hypothetical protein
MKKLLLIGLISCVPLLGKAQYLEAPNYSFDLSIGIGKVTSGGLMFRKNFYLGASKKLVIAPGIRFGYAAAQSVDYISAPADITKDEAKVDTVTFGKTAIFSPNIALNIGYRFNDKFSFMFDIDVIGLSFGGVQSGVRKPGKNSALQQNTPTAGNIGNPTSPNILLVGDNDKGSLSSAFSLHYNINDKVGVKAGAGFMFTEYTTDSKLGAANNDRWRAKTLQVTVGVIYNW